jgi:hypothetical protein
MEQVQISFDVSDRRPAFWASGVFAVAGGAMAWIVYSGAASESGSSGDGWIGALLVAALWSPAIFWILNRALGRTVLTEDCMTFRTLVSRKRVPWSQISSVEIQGRNRGRGGTVWVVRIIRAHGRPLVIPGAMARSDSDPKLLRDVATLRDYWMLVTGRDRGLPD